VGSPPMLLHLPQHRQTLIVIVAGDGSGGPLFLLRPRLRWKGQAHQGGPNALRFTLTWAHLPLGAATGVVMTFRPPCSQSAGAVTVTERTFRPLRSTLMAGFPGRLWVLSQTLLPRRRLQFL